MPQDNPRTAWHLTIFAILWAALLMLGPLHAPVFGQDPCRECQNGQHGQCTGSGCVLESLEMYSGNRSSEHLWGRLFPGGRWDVVPTLKDLTECGSPSRAGNQTFQIPTPRQPRPFEQPKAVTVEPHDAIVQVSYAVGNITSYCSGTTIDHFGLITIITCSHLFRDEKPGGRFVVKYSDGSRHSAWTIGYNHSRDLALLAISRPPIRGVKVSSQALKIGDIVTTWGWVKDYPQSATRGPVLHFGSPTQASSDSVIRIRGKSSPGRSGGAILNSSGELAGVIWGSGPDGIRGIRIEYVRVFLRELLERYKREHPETPGSSSPQGPPGEYAGDSSDPPLAPPEQQDAVKAGPAVDPSLLADVSAIREQLEKLTESIAASRELTVKIDVRSNANATAIVKLNEHNHESFTIDKAAIEAMNEEAIAALAKRLPPMYFQSQLPDGTLWEGPQPKRLGDTLILDSILFSGKTNQPISVPVEAE